jgi:hypothetical protein
LKGNTEGKRNLGKPKCGWEDNIKLDHRAVGWGVMKWTDLVKNRE